MTYQECEEASDELKRANHPRNKAFSVTSIFTKGHNQNTKGWRGSALERDYCSWRRGNDDPRTEKKYREKKKEPYDGAKQIIPRSVRRVPRLEVRRNVVRALEFRYERLGPFPRVFNRPWLNVAEVSYRRDLSKSVDEEEKNEENERRKENWLAA